VARRPRDADHPRFVVQVVHVRLDAARDPWSLLRRPLRLEPLPPGARCTVSPRHASTRAVSPRSAQGPIYALPSPLGRDARAPGWLASKTIWAWPPSLRTHPIRVLVRGLRLDRPGPMRFQLRPQWNSAPLTRELHIETNQTVGSFAGSTWGATVTLLLVRAPGCYGLQLDSEHGSSKLTINATRP
jgi:hypothetical protein